MKDISTPLVVMFAFIMQFLSFVLGTWPDFKVRRENARLKQVISEMRRALAKSGE